MTGPVLPRVLLVDDYVGFRRALRRRLRASYAVVEAASCEEAVEVLERDGDFAAMLLDVGFGPGHVRGDRALPSLRARWPLIPIVVVTVENEVTTAVSCLEAGATAFVSKDDPGMSELEPKLALAVATGQTLRREAQRAMSVELSGSARTPTGPPAPAPAGEVPLRAEAIRPLSEVEREYCERAITASGGSVRKAAERLGVPYSSFRRKLARWRRASTSD